MSTSLANRVGAEPATKKDRNESPTFYEERVIERRITLLRSEDERLFGRLSYTGTSAAAIREAVSSRPPLPETPRQLL